MLQEELTFGLLSEETGIAYEQIPKLWDAFLQQVEQRLSNTSCFDFSPLGFWSLRLEEEYLAEIQGGQSFIVPPRLILYIGLEASNEANTIYTLDDCLDALVLVTKLSEKTVSSFLSSLPDIIEKELQAKKEFYCPSLGLLSSTIDEESKLSGYKLTLDKAFAESLNKAFAMFSPVELHSLDNVAHQLSIKKLDSLESLNLPLDVYYSRENVESISENNKLMIEEEEMNENLDLGLGEDEDVIPEGTENQDLPLDEGVEDLMLAPSTDTLDLGALVEEREEKQSSRKKGCFFYLVLLTFLIALAYGLLLLYKSNKGQKIFKDILQRIECSEPQKEDCVSQETTDSLKVDSLTKANQVDTIKVESLNAEQGTYEEIAIRSGHTLRKIALKKYGHKVFWVYIYKENETIISDPNNIAIGTKLKLAPKSKYNINAKDTNSIKTALKLEHRLLVNLNKK